MPEYTVQPGDCLSSIAAAHGFADYRVVYDHEKNAELRKLRPDPNLIYPGDVVFVPDPKPDTYRVQTGRAHKFVIARPQTVLRLALEVSEPTRYELVFGDQKITGEVSDATPFEHAVPVDVAEAELSIWPSDPEKGKGSQQTWLLRLGHLDPIEEQSGVLGRLANLGYYAGDPLKPDEVAQSAAIRRFQAAEKLQETGQLDDDTRNALRARHDA